VIYTASGPITQYGYDQKVMHGGAHAPWKIWLPTQQMWQNPLIGWDSSSDVAHSSFQKMTFRTAEEASEFLRRQGISYVIEEKAPNYKPTQRPTRFASYGDNFRFVARSFSAAIIVSTGNSVQVI
jgi:ribosomal protein L36